MNRAEQILVEAEATIGAMAGALLGTSHGRA
jgi:hypothetical protein